MELSAAQQTAAFLWSIPLGAALGVLYGVFKFSRFAFRLGKAATVLLDVCFMLVCSVCVFLLSLLKRFRSLEILMMNSMNVRIKMAIHKTTMITLFPFPCSCFSPSYRIPIDLPLPESRL